jgi:hypothetical protein
MQASSLSLTVPRGKVCSQTAFQYLHLANIIKHLVSPTSPCHLTRAPAHSTTATKKRCHIRSSLSRKTTMNTVELLRRSSYNAIPPKCNCWNIRTNKTTTLRHSTFRVPKRTRTQFHLPQRLVSAVQRGRRMLPALSIKLAIH